ncbi:MAG TPA: DUF3365 domain-containing protein [Acidiferrobacterales bacterium]|nr:DUF3365 domain-containing protein [Acidiferrobacterales bacterium]
MFNHQSVAIRFIGLFIVVLLLIGSAYYLTLQNVYYTQLKSQAQTIADNVDAFGAWVSQYGRVWVKDDPSSYLGTIEVVETAGAAAPAPRSKAPAVEQKIIHFYSKNPALAQREFSEAIARSSSPAKFRMTSDNFMNPLNKPDSFEEEALRVIKDKKTNEYDMITPNGYRYARALYHKQSCIGCHGDAATAPADVTARYGIKGGFGFKEGDVAGIISVNIPTKSLAETSFRVVGTPQIVLVLAAFAAAFLFIKVVVVNPIKRLTNAADKVSVGENAELGLEKINPKSANEVHQLAFSINRLRTSLALVMQRMKGKDGPT